MLVNPLSAALISVLLSVGGQFSLKVGATKALALLNTSNSGTDAAPFLKLIRAALFEPMVLLGLALYGASAVLWIYVLARWDLSKSYPLLGLGLVLALLTGAFVLGERVTPERWLGCALMLAGLVLIVRS